MQQLSRQVVGERAREVGQYDVASQVTTDSAVVLGDAFDGREWDSISFQVKNTGANGITANVRGSNFADFSTETVLESNYVIAGGANVAREITRLTAAASNARNYHQFRYYRLTVWNTVGGSASTVQLLVTAIRVS